MEETAYRVFWNDALGSWTVQLQRIDSEQIFESQIEAIEAAKRLARRSNFYVIVLGLSDNQWLVTTGQDEPNEDSRPTLENKSSAHPMPVAEQPKQRVAGLHPGSMRMSKDFDDPLPDSFWLGEE